MKHNRLVFMITGVIVISATLLSACAPATTPTSAPATEAPAATQAPTEAPVVAPEPVTLQYWHTHSDAEAAQLDQVIAAFEAANSGITVEPSRYAYNDFKTALLTAISSDADLHNLLYLIPKYRNEVSQGHLDPSMLIRYHFAHSASNDGQNDESFWLHTIGHTFHRHDSKQVSSHEILRSATAFQFGIGVNRLSC